MDRKETIRLNLNNREEAKIAYYLDRTREGMKSAFIKEALEMYIEAIEQGLYECPLIGEEPVKEPKFKGMIEKQLKEQERLEKELVFDIDDIQC